MPKSRKIPKIEGWHVKEDVLLPRNETAGFKKSNLTHTDFDGLVLAQGVRVKLYRTAFCSNVKSVDGAEHEIDCPLCKGSGWLDKHPITTWAFLQTQTLEDSVFAEGIYDGNTVSATFLRGVEVQYFTLIELCDFTDIFYQRVKRQEGTLDVLDFPALRVNFITAQDGIDYFEGIDYCLDPNGNIKWKAGKGPFENQIYSIHYEAAQRYRAQKAMHVNRYANIDVKGGALHTKMNEQWMIHKEFFAERTDQNGDVIPPNKISE